MAQTRFGRLGVERNGKAIVALHWDAVPQLEAYDAGSLTRFDLPLAPHGSDFQQQVFAAMQAIPHGETLTYGEIAKALNCPAQPIGQACGANPIPVIIPCHSVLAKNGIGGFSGAGGAEGKIALLKHENGFPYLL